MRLFSKNILLKGNPKQWSYSHKGDGLGFTMVCTDLIYDGIKFVILGVSYPSSKALFSTSEDGETWTTPASYSLVDAPSGDWSFLAKNDSIYCAVCNPSVISDKCYVVTGISVSNWNSPQEVSNLKGRSFQSMCVDNDNNFILLSSDGVVSTSSNGINWTVPRKQLNYITCYDIFNDSINDRLIVVGFRKYAVKNNNSNTWNVYDLFPEYNKRWKTIDYIDGTYYVFADTGEITTSTDLENWTEPQKLPYLTVHFTNVNSGWIATAHSPSVQVLLCNDGVISTKRI